MASAETDDSRDNSEPAPPPTLVALGRYASAQVMYLGADGNKASAKSVHCTQHVESSKGGDPSKVNKDGAPHSATKLASGSPTGSGTSPAGNPGPAGNSPDCAVQETTATDNGPTGAEGAEHYGGAQYVWLGSSHASANVVLCQAVCCVLGTQPNGLDSETGETAVEPAATVGMASGSTHGTASAQSAGRRPRDAPLLSALTRCSNLLEQQLGRGHSAPAPGGRTHHIGGRGSSSSSRDHAAQT